MVFDSYLIEIDEIEAGLLIRSGGAYVFHAVASRWRAFEGTIFQDPWSAERTLRRHTPRAGRAGGEATRHPLPPDDRRRRHRTG